MNYGMRRVIRNMWARRMRRKNGEWPKDGEQDAWGHDSLVDGEQRTAQNPQPRMTKAMRKSVRAYGREALR